MEIQGDKLSVFVGVYARASIEYNPKREALIEGSLVRIKKAIEESKTDNNTPHASVARVSSARVDKGGRDDK